MNEVPDNFYQSIFNICEELKDLQPISKENGWEGIKYHYGITTSWLKDSKSGDSGKYVNSSNVFEVDDNIDVKDYPLFVQFKKKINTIINNNSDYYVRRLIRDNQFFICENKDDLVKMLIDEEHYAGYFKFKLNNELPEKSLNKNKLKI